MGGYELDYKYDTDCSTRSMKNPTITIADPSARSWYEQPLTQGLPYEYKGSQYAIDITFKHGSLSSGACGPYKQGSQETSSFVIYEAFALYRFFNQPCNPSIANNNIICINIPLCKIGHQS